MRKLVTYFFILFCVNVFAQHTYIFDYCMIYEYKDNENSPSLSKRFIYVNSQKTGYFLLLHFDLRKESSQVALFDVNNDTQYIYTTEQLIPIDSVNIDELFAKPIKLHYSFSEYRKRAEDKYDVSYIEENGVNKMILKAYQNPKKKKLVAVQHFILQSHPELKNQFYVNPALVFAYKFDITQVKTEDLVAESYLINQESNTKEQIWKLIDIKPLDFQINIPAE